RWRVTVIASVRCVGGMSTTTVVDLDNASPDLVIPRPFGFRVSAADSLIFLVSFLDVPSARDSALSVRLTIEYDPETIPGRLSAQAMRYAPDSTADVTPSTRTWEWVADSTGIIQAIAGQALKTAHSLVLQDVATGEVLWRVRSGSYGTGSVFGDPSG